MADNSSFWDGLSAVGFLNAGAQWLVAREQADAAEVDAQTKQYEMKQRAAVEKANLEKAAEQNARADIRRDFNNEQMWKLASWLTASLSATMILAAILKLLRSK